MISCSIRKAMSRPMSATARSIASSSPTVTGTTTVTLENPAASQPHRQQHQQPETLVLRLNPKKKKVTWKEGTVDNEFMQKKSSKKCCIFHKEKSFDEDDSDEDDDHPQNNNHGCCSPDHWLLCKFPIFWNIRNWCFVGSYRTIRIMILIC